jgi:hypothetical protein
MLTVLLLLALMAFAVAVAAAMGKAPLWVAVLLLSIALLLQTVPIR